MRSLPDNVVPIRPVINCPACGFKIFDGFAIRCRAVRFLPDDRAEAKCRCKHWVEVPARYSG